MKSSYDGISGGNGRWSLIEKLYNREYGFGSYDLPCLLLIFFFFPAFTKMTIGLFYHGELKFLKLWARYTFSFESCSLSILDTGIEK